VSGSAGLVGRVGFRGFLPTPNKESADKESAKKRKEGKGDDHLNTEVKKRVSELKP
jgi:hypothetical protein